MKTILAAALALTALAALPAAAQDVRHCFETAPAGTDPGTPEQQTSAAALAFAYHEPPIYYRRACGMDLSADRAYVADSLAKSGCSVDSDFGRLRMNVFSGDLMALTGGIFDEGTMERNPEVKEEVCAVIATFPALADMDRPAYGKMSKTIRTINEALRANAGKLK